MEETIQLLPTKSKRIKKREALKYHIKTFGCQMNEYDTEKVSGLFESDGMVLTERYEDADILFINTCTIRENADNKLYGTLGELKRWKLQNINRRLLVGGCAAQKDRDLIRKKAPWVDVVLGTNNISNILELLDHSDINGPITEIYEQIIDDHTDLPSIRESSTTAMVTIQIGCNNSCTFCIVPQVRGSEISRRPTDIYDEIVKLTNNKVKEIILLGQNVNSYGRDLKIDGNRTPYFAELLQMLCKIDNLERIRFVSPHPKDINQKVIDVVNENPKICNHIHLPLQSGSDQILSKMHRGYNKNKYLDKVKMIRQTIGNVSITSDIIVGFPGETEYDFNETIEVMQESKFDSVYLYKFSPRPGTKASYMADSFVNEKVVDDRFQILKNLQTDISMSNLSKYLDSTQKVLIDGLSKKDKTKSTGKTDGGNIVILDKIYPVGKLQNFKIIRNTPFVLYGESI